MPGDGLVREDVIDAVDGGEDLGELALQAEVQQEPAPGAGVVRQALGGVRVDLQAAADGQAGAALGEHREEAGGGAALVGAVAVEDEHQVRAVPFGGGAGPEHVGSGGEAF